MHGYERVAYSVIGDERGGISVYVGGDSGDIIGDDCDWRFNISGDDGRRCFCSEDSSLYSFHNFVESVGVYGIVGYRSQTIHYSSNNPCDHGRLLRLSVSYCCVHKVFTVMKEFISVVMIEGVDLCLNRPATLLLKIRQKVLKVTRDVNIGIRPAFIPPFIKVELEDFWVSMLW